MPRRRWVITVLSLALASSAMGASPPTTRPAEVPNVRRPANDEELRYWLENMLWHHRFAADEIRAATGMSVPEITSALRRFDIREENRPARPASGPLLVLPYPGGRHPRIGFLEGAVEPQRETKVSIFAPWDDRSYLVADVPEAIWCNGSLLYLAHTHRPTVWTEQGIELEKLEWNRRPDGTLDFERKLPNAVKFGTKVVPRHDAVWFEMWLTNGTPQTLTGLRVQMCNMLKGMIGFTTATKEDRVNDKPYTACRSADGKRYVIAAWEPCEKLWLNPPVPCLHSDPQFPDCKPDETQRLRGVIAFYEGSDVTSAFRKLDATGWRKLTPTTAPTWPGP
ncbi:MAG: hypothetical protein HY718_02320 [Planctomycetes bacterium]|nr:hypothetical protein [Planctomycetota bacterium]